MYRSQILALALSSAFGFTHVLAATYTADPAATAGPGYYLNILGQLKPGDTLQLPAGTYRERLNLTGLNGTSDAWITITGPETGSPAIITTDSTCCNVVQLGNTAYVAIKNLSINSNSETVGESIDAVNAKGEPTHDILIENCTVVGAGLYQQTVGISTKSTAWNWTIRANTIDGAGTGIYLGNSDGTEPFVNGVIENNLFVDSIGYDTEIKYQTPYTPPANMPSGPHRTLIRNNVFLKRIAQASLPAGKLDGPRPNLLVGGFPSTGPGMSDLYEIYGNFFYENPDGEALLQASGRVTIHDNIFVGASWASIALMDHDLPLEYADVYNNTILGGQQGIWFGNAARERSSVVGNLVFADSAISGAISVQSSNITDSIANAGLYVRAPSTELGQIDLYPLPGKAQGDSLDYSAYTSQTDFDVDFNGSSKGERLFRGAYAGDGDHNPGWTLQASIKPRTIAPDPPTNLTAD